MSDAGGGIGVGRAIQSLDRTGKIQIVGLDDLSELLQLIGSAVVDSTAATKPRSQGYWSVLSLWQYSPVPHPSSGSTRASRCRVRQQTSVERGSSLTTGRLI
ncbi:hypothetical protein [Synechococcus sp. CBW1006]|uniref:substrate-binding domain-containing protein n=1 Tax=Synechococcus sp. CBW1006 TaxID=1353138 RepID=UPI00351C2346